MHMCAPRFDAPGLCAYRPAMPPLPPGFVPPCLPTKTRQPPSGDAWLREIKHDGFRIIARKDGTRLRLYSPHHYSAQRGPRFTQRAISSRPMATVSDGGTL
jgi:ATP-dependent DNA ligase